MRIQRLELYRYKRLALSFIETLIYRPDAFTQLILGTNGSGKSSLLGELLPSVVQGSDFYKGGYKVLDLEHQGSLYRLVAEIDRKTTYHFLKDGEVFNETGTSQVQKSLIEQEFGLTDLHYQLLAGHFSFSSLTPTKRRELITAMSHQDFDYAFSLYKKLQSYQRDQQGALKHSRSRIQQEKAQRDENRQVELRPRVEQLTEEIQALMRAQRRQSIDSSSVLAHLEQYHKRIEQLCETIINQPLPIPKGELIDGEQSLSARLQELRGDIESTRNLVSHYAEEHERIERLTQQLSDQDNGRDLTTQRQELADAYTRNQQYKFYFELDFDSRELSAQLQPLKQSLVEIFSTLPDNSEGFYTEEHQKTIERSIEQNKKTLQQLESRRMATNTRIEQIKNQEQVTCPQCYHQFKPGIGESELEQQRKTHSDIETQIDEYHKANEHYKEHYRQIESYRRQIQQLRQLAYSYPQARTFFQAIFAEKRIYYQPTQYIGWFDRFWADVEVNNELYRLQEKIASIDELIERQSALDEQQGGSLSAQLKRLDEKVTSLNGHLQAQRQRLIELEHLEKSYRERQANYQSLLELLKELRSENSRYIEALRDELIQQTITQDQAELAEKQTQLRHLESLDTIIGDLEASEKSLDETTHRYKALTEALSPSDGVIADQIFELIGEIVDRVNRIIEPIYTYQLQVLPCKLDAHELDFRFPVTTANEDITIPDIAKASSGQREIIDYAFKLVALLDLTDGNYPLYFDELGRFQDEAHHGLLMDHLRQLMDGGGFPQMFLISHFAVGHGSFSQAEVNVLNPSNVTVPSRYNGQLELS